MQASLGSPETSASTPTRSVRSIIAPSPDELATLISTADIICTMTSSTTPLFSGPVKPNTAIILIGSYKPVMHEIPSSVLAKGMVDGQKLVVDSREACLREAGELIDAQVKEEDVVELGQVLSGGTIGQEEKGGVFIFKSVSLLLTICKGISSCAIADHPRYISGRHISAGCRNR
jgi:ornithine cyclodeaminase/alanine dehydrogenase-like protein (mu-crystallin family)